MAKGEKRVPINAIDRVIKESFDNKVTDIWNGISVTMKRSLSITETLEFVNDVVMSCLGDTNGYLPEVMDFAIKSNVLSRYTNISLPDNLEHRHEIIYRSDIVPFVCQHINMEQLREITNSIDRKVTYLCDANIMNTQKQMAELISAFEKIQESTENIFANIAPDDVAKIIAALENGVLNEEKLVRAYLKHSSPDDSRPEGEE